MDTFIPHIGKNIIEILTLGMYENAHYIYREYVQNAADQIDVAVEDGILEKRSDGRIDILIDNENRLISIEDNATGIKAEDSLRFLGDVANSQKDRTKRKGFRGIGRLGGLGYCNTLIFETSYKGEPIKSIITLNAKQLKNIIEDKSIKMDAATVISVITSLDKENEDADNHYFKVILKDVTNDEILDKISVKNYLSMVAPVPFDTKFNYSKEIYSYFNKNNVKIDEYDVHLCINNEKLYKAYKVDNIHSKTGYKPIEVIGIDFIKIVNEQNDLLALGWYFITDLLNYVIHPENIERGFRLRKDNIQIGDEDTLNGYFKEDRFNHHFIGEIYVVGDVFIPNARRDFFNDNNSVHILKILLKEKFDELQNIAHISSKTHSALKTIDKFRENKILFNNQEIRSDNERQHYNLELEKTRNNAQKAINSLARINKKSKTDDNIQIIYDKLVGNINTVINDLNELEIKDTIIEKTELSKLNDSEKKIVLDIFKIIENNLEINEAENLKQRIKEYYN